jgi:hypothetical protein
VTRLDLVRLPALASRLLASKVPDMQFARWSVPMRVVLRRVAGEVLARPARTRVAARQREMAEAWEELRTRPELTWVPPLWRAESKDHQAHTIERRHAISALDRNLKVDVTHREHGICIRIATGPLEDRQTPTGADPIAPSAILHPGLDVTATSFEQAVIALRDAARRVYGPA